jgi:hypothetical protein
MISSQSLPVGLNKDSCGKFQWSLILSLNALAFVHDTVAWKLVSSSIPQIVQVLCVSNVLPVGLNKDYLDFNQALLAK